MKSWGLHLRFAARQLKRDSGFVATVVITLALSIGANTAIFSLVNALMLNSLPYSHPERMGTIYARVTGAHALGRTCRHRRRDMGTAARQRPGIDLRRLAAPPRVEE